VARIVGTDPSRLHWIVRQGHAAEMTASAHTPAWFCSASRAAARTLVRCRGNRYLLVRVRMRPIPLECPIVCFLLLRPLRHVHAGPGRRPRLLNHLLLDEMLPRGFILPVAASARSRASQLDQFLRRAWEHLIILPEPYLSGFLHIVRVILRNRAD